MRRSTTSAATDRRPRTRARTLCTAVTELICALLLVGQARSRPPPVRRSPRPHRSPRPRPRRPREMLRDGRTVRLDRSRRAHTAPLLARDRRTTRRRREARSPRSGVPTGRATSSSSPRAPTRSSARWPAAAPDTAATTTAERIMFAPGAAAMSDAALRIVLRHELFHYAARADTAADAPRWLTEGVADFVGRPPQPPSRTPPHWRDCPPTPTWTPRDRRSAGLRPRMVVQPVRRRHVRHRRRCGRCTCGPAAHGHPDAATAVRDTLGTDLPRCSPWRHWLTASLTAMSRVLLVTNDFPPRRGGIQSYLQDLVGPPRRGRDAHADGVRAEMEGVRRL